MDRRLAAVMMADVVGYSRLLGEDEAATIEALRDLHASVVPAVVEEGGRIVDMAGDGILAEFPSVAAAVQCALFIQAKMPSINKDRPAGRWMELRIGVHQGDIVVDGERTYGDGINVAARLQMLAEAGGVAISGRVFEDICGKLDGLAWSDAGPQNLKNIARPVQVYRLAPAKPGSLKRAADALPPSLPDRPSIVVLPFQNMSGDAEQDYFADGMVEDITTALSRLRWLFVIARNSSFTYKGRAVDVKQVGRELGVRYVLEGSVRKAGTRVRITGQLIDAATGAHLWADRFDGELADIFDLQDQVTASVVGAIGARLEQAEIERAKRKPPANLDAYDLYLRGMAAFYGFSRATNADALALFTRAIELDPQYGCAYGMAARCYLQRLGFGWIVDREGEIAEVRRLAASAAEFGREDAVALSTAGASLLIVAGDLERGTTLLERGLALDGNLAWAWHFKSLASSFNGDPELAIREATLSMRLSPQDPQMFAIHIAIAFGHYFARRFAEASSWADSAQLAQPRFFIGACLAAAAAAMSGRDREAKSLMVRARELNPELRLSGLEGLVVVKRQEDFLLWKEGLRRAGLPE